MRLYELFAIFAVGRTFKYIEMAKRREIRNSTAEFLIFQIEGKEQGVEVYYKDKTVWCTQKAMGMLFDVNVPAISKHLKNIYEQGELQEERTVSKMEIVRTEGGRLVKRNTVFYNLDAVISVGYRVNSIRATQFRQWATSVLREYAIRGYVLDRKRMENGTFLDEDYFEPLNWNSSCRRVKSALVTQTVSSSANHSASYFL